MIRDAALAVAGTLNPQIGGRSVRIPIEPEVYELIFTEHERDGLWPLNPDKNIQNRRGLYLYNKRQVRVPLLAAFDQPDAVTSCPVRPVSTRCRPSRSSIPALCRRFHIRSLPVWRRHAATIATARLTPLGS
jgi:Protein of unknown function (DUF1553)